MVYKVIYDRKNCIGANACVGALPEFWSLDDEKKAVLKGSTYNPETGKYELVIDEKDLERLKESAMVCPVLVIDILELKNGQSVLELNRGSEVEKESAPVIRARTEKSSKTKTDPKGFFTIRISPETSLIKAYYYNLKHQLLFIIEGKSAEELIHTIIQEGFVSSPSYSAYLGSELQKAEIALKKNLPYRQDQPIF